VFSIGEAEDDNGLAAGAQHSFLALAE